MISNQGSISTNLNRLMDSMGFPKELGNILGAALEARIENNIVVARNLFDAFSSISVASLDTLMTGAFGSAAQILRPHHNYNHHFALHHSTYHEQLPHHCIDYTDKAYQNVVTMLARCATPLAQQKILQSLAAGFNNHSRY